MILESSQARANEQQEAERAVLLEAADALKAQRTAEAMACLNALTMVGNQSVLFKKLYSIFACIHGRDMQAVKKLQTLLQESEGEGLALSIGLRTRLEGVLETYKNFLPNTLAILDSASPATAPVVIEAPSARAKVQKVFADPQTSPPPPQPVQPTPEPKPKPKSSAKKPKARGTPRAEWANPTIDFGQLQTENRNLQVLIRKADSVGKKLEHKPNLYHAFLRLTHHCLEKNDYKKEMGKFDALANGIPPVTLSACRESITDIQTARTYLLAHCHAFIADFILSPNTHQEELRTVGAIINSAIGKDEPGYEDDEEDDKVQPLLG